MKPTLKQILTWMRWPNLVIVVFTLLLIRYGILKPALEGAGLSLLIDEFSFVILCLITVLVTFSGYVINDIFDRETDTINKPAKQAVGVWISPGKAKGIYIATVLVGGLLALYLAIKHQSLDRYWVYPVAVGMLFWYSYSLKSTVLWGNLLVSFFCAAVALLLAFTEMEAISQYPGHIMEPLVFYALFAGLSNMIREIIKDAEDVEGDKRSGVTTLATRFGVHASRNLALFFVFLLAAVLTWFLASDLLDSKWIYGLLTATPLLILLILLVSGKKNTNWNRLSALSKLLMLGGLLGLLFLR